MERFEEFLTERKYLKNVSDKTLVYYKCSFRSWEVHSQGDWKVWIVNMGKAGLSAVSINTYICAMNASWKWTDAGLKVPYLKEEQKDLATLTPDVDPPCILLICRAVLTQRAEGSPNLGISVALESGRLRDPHRGGT